MLRPTRTTSPGGADTQIQYNNAGAFGGSATFTLDTLNGILTYNPGSVALIVDAASQFATLDSVHPVYCGDYGGNGNGTKITVNDSAGEIDIDGKGGTVVIGDVLGVGNGTTIEIKDAGPKVTVNKPLHADGDLVLPDTGGGAPADTPAAGTVRYDQTNDRIYVFDGANWHAH